MGSNGTTKFKKGVIDPISLIGIGFLIVTLFVGIASVNKKGLSFNINEKAASAACTMCQKVSEDPSLCTMCASAPTTLKKVVTKDCGFCKANLCVNCASEDYNLGQCSTSAQCAPKVTTPVVTPDPVTTCLNSGGEWDQSNKKCVVTQPSGTQIITVPVEKTPVEQIAKEAPPATPDPMTTCDLNGGAWDQSNKKCVVTSITTTSGGISSGTQILTEQQTLNIANNSSATTPISEEIQREKSICLADGGTWIDTDNTCSYTQQNALIAAKPLLFLSKNCRDTGGQWTSNGCSYPNEFIGIDQIYTKEQGDSCVNDLQCKTGKCGKKSVVEVNKQCIDNPSGNPTITNEQQTVITQAADLSNPISTYSQSFMGTQDYTNPRVAEYSICNGDYNCNLALASAENGLTKGTSGKFGNYVQSYAPQNVQYNYLSLGYNSLEQCLADNYAMVNQIRCYGYNPTTDQIASSIRLGTDLTQKASAALGAISVGSTLANSVKLAASNPITLNAVKQVAGSTLGEAFKQMAQIQTSMNTLNTVATCTEGGENCGKEATQTAINWAFLGSTDLLSSAYAASSGPKAVYSVALNTAASTGQAIINYGATVEACKDGMNFGCGINIAGDALLAYGFYQNYQTAKTLWNSYNRASTVTVNGIVEDPPELASSNQNAISPYPSAVDSVILSESPSLGLTGADDIAITLRPWTKPVSFTNTSFLPQLIQPSLTNPLSSLSTGFGTDLGAWPGNFDSTSQSDKVQLPTSFTKNIVSPDAPTLFVISPDKTPGEKFVEALNANGINTVNLDDPSIPPRVVNGELSTNPLLPERLAAAMEQGVLNGFCTQTASCNTLSLVAEKALGLLPESIANKITFITTFDAISASTGVNKPLFLGTTPTVKAITIQGEYPTLLTLGQPQLQGDVQTLIWWIKMSEGSDVSAAPAEIVSAYTPEALAQLKTDVVTTLDTLGIKDAIAGCTDLTSENGICGMELGNVRFINPATLFTPETIASIISPAADLAVTNPQPTSFFSAVTNALLFRPTSTASVVANQLSNAFSGIFNETGGGKFKIGGNPADDIIDNAIMDGTVTEKPITVVNATNSKPVQLVIQQSVHNATGGIYVNLNNNISSATLGKLFEQAIKTVNKDQSFQINGILPFEIIVRPTNITIAFTRQVSEIDKISGGLQRVLTIVNENLKQKNMPTIDIQTDDLARYFFKEPLPVKNPAKVIPGEKTIYQKLGAEQRTEILTRYSNATFGLSVFPKQNVNNDQLTKAVKEIASAGVDYHVSFYVEDSAKGYIVFVQEPKLAKANEDVVKFYKAMNKLLTAEGHPELDIPYFDKNDGFTILDRIKAGWYKLIDNLPSIGNSPSGDPTVPIQNVETGEQLLGANPKFTMEGGIDTLILNGQPLSTSLVLSHGAANTFKGVAANGVQIYIKLPQTQSDNTEVQGQYNYLQKIIKIINTSNPTLSNRIVKLLDITDANGNFKGYASIAIPGTALYSSDGVTGGKMNEQDVSDFREFFRILNENGISPGDISPQNFIGSPGNYVVIDLEPDSSSIVTGLSIPKNMSEKVEPLVKLGILYPYGEVLVFNSHLSSDPVVNFENMLLVMDALNGKPIQLLDQDPVSVLAPNKKMIDDLLANGGNKLYLTINKKSFSPTNLGYGEVTFELNPEGQVTKINIYSVNNIEAISVVESISKVIPLDPHLEVTSNNATVKIPATIHTYQVMDPTKDMSLQVFTIADVILDKFFLSKALDIPVIQGTISIPVKVNNAIDLIDKYTLLALIQEQIASMLLTQAGNNSINMAVIKTDIAGGKPDQVQLTGGSNPPQVAIRIGTTIDSNNNIPLITLSEVDPTQVASGIRRTPSIATLGKYDSTVKYGIPINSIQITKNTIQTVANIANAVLTRYPVNSVTVATRRLVLTAFPNLSTPKLLNIGANACLENAQVCLSIAEKLGVNNLRIIILQSNDHPDVLHAVLGIGNAIVDPNTGTVGTLDDYEGFNVYASDNSNIIPDRININGALSLFESIRKMSVSGLLNDAEQRAAENGTAGELKAQRDANNVMRAQIAKRSWFRLINHKNRRTELDNGRAGVVEKAQNAREKDRSYFATPIPKSNKKWWQ